MSQSDVRVEETTIADLHAAMRAGEVTSRALVETYLQRIDAYDHSGPALNAILGVNDRAIERAEALDEALGRTGELVGPLHGIPVLVRTASRRARSTRRSDRPQSRATGRPRTR